MKEKRETPTPPSRDNKKKGSLLQSPSRHCDEKEKRNCSEIWKIGVIGRGRRKEELMVSGGGRLNP